MFIAAGFTEQDTNAVSDQLVSSCWDDPLRSLVKAAQVWRRECNHLMVALYEGGVQSALVSILDLIGGPGCRLNRRKNQPGTDQLLEEG